MRWGLIGTGLHAEQRIAPALASCAGQTLVGVVGSSEAKARALTERLGVGRPHASLDALLGDAAIDAVFISTPNDQHCAQTVRAAAAGKHVLVEKPMALCPADCRAMIDACAAAGVRLGVGFQLRHHPVHRELRRLIGAGELGEIVLVRGEWHTAYGPWTNWRSDPARAGSDVLGAVGVHALDLIQALAGGEVEEVNALIDRSPETGMDQTVATSLRFSNGVIAQATATRRAFSPLSSVYVWGSAGSAGGIGTLGMKPTGRLLRTRGSEIEEHELEVPDLYAAQLEAFARAVRSRDEPDASGQDGLRSVLLTERLLGDQALARTSNP